MNPEKFGPRKIVYWSDEDNCFIGQCPELFGGGVHGSNEVKVYRELCQVVDEWLHMKPLRSRKHHRGSVGRRDSGGRRHRGRV